MEKFKTVIIENTWLPGMNKGWGNGYVLIPEGHPLHGKHYDSIEVDVNGGLTFSELITEELVNGWNEISGNGLTKDDIGGWLVGFDTCHYNDTMERWPKEAVKAETDRLAEQLTALNTQSITR